MEKQISFLALSSKEESPTTKINNKPPCWNIFIDGAARNNPGPAGAGIFIFVDKKTIVKKGFYLGSKTNNQAEYLALLLALFFANQELIKQNSKAKLAIISDSELLVKQVKGIYRVKNQELVKIKTAVDLLLSDKTYSIKHVLRKDNKVADKLANEGIDLKQKLPAAFLALLQNYDISI